MIYMLIISGHVYYNFSAGEIYFLATRIFSLNVSTTFLFPSFVQMLSNVGVQSSDIKRPLLTAECHWKSVCT